MITVLQHSMKVFFTKLQEKDKRLHMVWSFWLTIVAQILWPTPWAFAAVFMIGFAKECWDARFGSGWCIFDMSANVFGSLVAVIVVSGLPQGLFEA